MPFGVLGPQAFVLQGTDEYYDEKLGRWLAVPAASIGKWSDECFPTGVSFRGYLIRLSGAVHHSRFVATYGRPKPPRLFNETKG